MATLEYSIASSGDDGYASEGSFSNTSALFLGSAISSGAGILSSFLRWVVTIPAGAIISSAYVSMYYYGKEGTIPQSTIYFEKSANPSAITSYANYGSRSKTTASVTWTPPGSAEWNNSPELKTIIQELVNAYDYSSGAAMQCLIDGSGSGNNYVEYYSYDWEHAPILHIEYSLPGGRSRTCILDF